MGQQPAGTWHKQSTERASGEAENEELLASIDCELGDGSASLERAMTRQEEGKGSRRWRINI